MALRCRPDGLGALRYAETLAPLFDSFLAERERWGARRGPRLRGQTPCQKVAILIAAWVTRWESTRLGGHLRARSRRIEAVNLVAMINALKVLESLLRCSLTEAIVAVDAKALARLKQDQAIIVKRLAGGNPLAIIAACGRFYFRLFSFSSNSPLRSSVLEVMSLVNMRNPNLLDMVNVSELGAASEAMLRAAENRDVVGANAAFDLMLGDGPIRRRNDQAKVSPG